MSSDETSDDKMINDKMKEDIPDNDMVNGAKNAFSVVLSLRVGDKVLVVTDQEKLAIGQVFRLAGEEMGAEVTVFILDPSARPLIEIPYELANLIPGNDIIVNAFSGIAEETPFRIKLIKQEVTTNARIGHAPGITMEMMKDGPMNTDYTEITEKADHLMELFKDAKEVHVTAPSGTDIILNIDGRKFETDVFIKAGTFGNLPAGEIWCSPVEDGANGVTVCDGSIGDVGQVPTPLKIIVKDGRIVSMECDDEGFRERLWEFTHVDDMSDVIGELGIGLNPAAKLTGNLLEDEKAGGTSHIAFGNNSWMPGGRNTSSTHRDFLFYNPTMKITYTDKTQKIIMRDGELVL